MVQRMTLVITRTIWIWGQVVYVSDRIILGAEHLDPGSSPTPARPAVANVVKNSHTDGLGQEKIKKSQQQASNKLDNGSGMI